MTARHGTSQTAEVMVNGRFLSRGDATLDIEDRGMMFADGVYEVVRYYGGRALAIEAHCQRMAEGLAAIEIDPPEGFDRFGAMSDEVVRRNGLAEAKVYWQVTRGVAPRDHDGAAATRPTSMMIAYREAALDFGAAVPTGSVVLLPDERWLRCSIKTTMLLPNVLAKRRARQAGAAEAILHRDGLVTEGAATNVLVVSGGRLRTHPTNGRILGGITRRIVLGLAAKSEVDVDERPVTVDELLAAEEVMLCGTTSHLTAVTRVDGRVINKGEPGPVARSLHEALMAHIHARCHVQAAS